MIDKSETQQILDSIRRIVQGLRVSSRLAEKRVGISGAQLFVLQALAGSKSLSVNELAVRTKTHQSSVSVVVTRLEEAGLITRTRDPRDARRVSLQLSPSGRKLLKKVPPTTQERMIEALEAMPARDRAQLARLLNHVVTETGLPQQPAPLFFEEQTHE
jgi:DNA-binding MarR family transcriptional regulator